ncbi:MAG TPA: hypothetical protein VD840_15875 [Sinorhizobium sp.]|nr:hypothetical protein [Sinorhizobium sp.]
MLLAIFSSPKSRRPKACRRDAANLPLRPIPQIALDQFSGGLAGKIDNSSKRLNAFMMNTRRGLDKYQAVRRNITNPGDHAALGL